MTKLKLKPEFDGLIITRKHFIIGEITFDSNKIDPDKYENYANSGFEDLFYIEPIEDNTTTEKVVLTEDKPSKRTKKK
jgi:hypothetical protein